MYLLFVPVCINFKYYNIISLYKYNCYIASTLVSYRGSSTVNNSLQFISLQITKRWNIICNLLNMLYNFCKLS